MADVNDLKNLDNFLQAQYSVHSKPDLVKTAVWKRLAIETQINKSGAWWRWSFVAVGLATVALVVVLAGLNLRPKHSVVKELDDFVTIVQSDLADLDPEKDFIDAEIAFFEET
jgi:hypothetical protein